MALTSLVGLSRVHSLGYTSRYSTDMASGICQLSNGNFLPNVITCIKGNCDNSLNTNDLVGPLQLACNLAGVPISSSAIANAENIISATSSISQTGYLTATSTFASAGTTFVVGVPESVSSGQFGYYTSTGTPTTTYVGIATTNGVGGAAGAGGASVTYATNSLGQTFGVSGSAPTTTPAGGVPTTYSYTSNTFTSPTTTTPGIGSTTSPSIYTSGSTTFTSSRPGSTSPTTNNGGSPFQQNDGRQYRPNALSWVGLAISLFVGFA